MEFRLYIYGYNSTYAFVGMGNRTQDNDEDLDLNIEGIVTGTDLTACKVDINLSVVGRDRIVRIMLNAQSNFICFQTGDE